MVSSNGISLLELMIIFVFHIDAWATKNIVQVDTHERKTDDWLV